MLNEEKKRMCERGKSRKTGREREVKKARKKERKTKRERIKCVTTACA